MDEEMMDELASCSSEDIVCDEGIDYEQENSQDEPQESEEDDQCLDGDDASYGGQTEDLGTVYEPGQEIQSEVDLESCKGNETQLEELISEEKHFISLDDTAEEEAVDSMPRREINDDNGLREDLETVDYPCQEIRTEVDLESCDENETHFKELMGQEEPFISPDVTTAEAAVEKKIIDVDDDVNNRLDDTKNKIDNEETLDDGTKVENIIEIMSHEKNVDGTKSEPTAEVKPHLKSIMGKVDVYDQNIQVLTSPTIKSKDKIDVMSEEALKETYGEAPKVITHLESKIVPCGTRIRLFCSISGDPTPKVVWKRNRKRIPESTRYLYNSSEFGFSIDIFNVKSSDAGEYVCVASNCNGTTKTQAYLQVVGHREDSPSEPRFIECPEDAVTAKGEAITFEWRISGTPFPRVLWFKNSEKIETGLHVDVFCSHRGYCHLRITNVDENDCAVYSCYLENDVGSAVSTVQLALLDDGKMISSQKGVSRGMPLNKENTPDNYLDFLLQSDTFNPHSVKSHRVILGSHLKADKAPDFVCAPYGLRVVNSGPTWVILSWFPPMHFRENVRALNYLLEKKQVSGSLWREVTQTHNTFFTAHELQRGKAYIFRVSAEKNGHWSLPSIMSVPVVCALK